MKNEKMWVLRSDTEAIDLIKNVTGMCNAGGFNLTKVACNSTPVMETVPTEKYTPAFKNFQINESPTIEKPLGVQWTIENDSLGFRITFKSGSLCRRGMLRSISSIFDLLGIAAPFLLKGRKILQTITGDKASWDDDVSDSHAREWNIWKNDLVSLQQLTFPRCYKPANFGTVEDMSLHVFGDGCNVGYGAACYIRQVDNQDNIAVALVMGKAKVSPLKPITIPRLELTASTLAVKISALVRDEMGLKDIRKYYYTDNKVALGYIYNDVKRFRVFVANRVQKIRSYSSKEQWSYVNTKENPADDASRGLSLKQSSKVQRWLNGPSLLYKKEINRDMESASAEVSDDDPEVVKSVHTCAIPSRFDLLNRLEVRISSWIKMKRVLAMMLLFIRKLRKTPGLSKPEKLSVKDVQEAESLIITFAQQRAFETKLAELPESGGKINKSNKK